jgi:hypothetical protein
VHGITTVDIVMTTEHQDSLGGNQQNHQQHHTERHPPAENIEDLDSVGGGSPSGECLDLNLDLGDSIENSPLHSDSNDRQKVDGLEGVKDEEFNRPVQRDEPYIIRDSHPNVHHFQLLNKRQQTDVSISEQPSQHASTQRPVSYPASDQAQLAGPEAQNKERLLMARKDQSFWDEQAIWAFGSDEPSVTKKKSYRSVEEKKKIKVRHHPGY